MSGCHKFLRETSDPSIERFLIANSRIRDSEKNWALIPRTTFMPALTPEDYKKLGVNGVAEQPVGEGQV